MKTKTSLVILLFIAVFTLVNFGYANRTANVIPAIQEQRAVSCPNLSRIYLNQDNDTDTIPDFFLYLNSNFVLNGATNDHTAGQIIRPINIGDNGTRVRYFIPMNNMLYKMALGGAIGPIDNSTFWRASRVFPYNTPVRGIATTPNRVVFEAPSDYNVNKKTVSIIYDYVYRYAVGFDGTTHSNYRYNRVPNMGWLSNTGLTYITTLPGAQGNRRRAWSPSQTISDTSQICRNYELRRCGDGIIDSHNNTYVNQFTGEICDDGPNNGQPGYCEAGCGISAGNFYCGDNIINDGSYATVTASGGYMYGPTYFIGGIEQIEQCDEGENNDDNYQISGCSTYCEYNMEPESFPEELR